MFNLIAFFIVVFGGINWLCIGVFQFDFIAGIFGSQAHFISRFIYTIIGLFGVYLSIAIPIKKGKIYEPKQNNNDDKDYKDKIHFSADNLKTKGVKKAILKSNIRVKKAKNT